ncbi:MAG: hypothetical protein ACQKBW_03340, partial [Puniceicoccales bacterium]
MPANDPKPESELSAPQKTPEEHLPEEASDERVSDFAEAFEEIFAHGRPDPSSWIGVGLDGTLAHHDGSAIDATRIGEPVPDMFARVIDWSARGHTVKVFTPRAADETAKALVEKWLADHGLPDLEVTCEKDLYMVELWDTRSVQVIANTGQPVGESSVEQMRQVSDNETLSQKGDESAPNSDPPAQ